MKSLKIHVGRKIAAARNKLGLTQAEVASHDLLDVEIPTVQRWEYGTNWPKAEHLEALAKILKVPVAYFFEEDDKKPASVKVLSTAIDELDQELKELKEQVHIIPVDIFETLVEGVTKTDYKSIRDILDLPHPKKKARSKKKSG